MFTLKIPKSWYSLQVFQKLREYMLRTAMLPTDDKPEDQISRLFELWLQSPDNKLKDKEFVGLQWRQAKIATGSNSLGRFIFGRKC